MFHRTGSGVVPYGDFGPVIEHFIGIGSDDSIIMDVDAALAYLRGLGFSTDRKPAAQRDQAEPKPAGQPAGPWGSPK